MEIYFLTGHFICPADILFFKEVNQMDTLKKLFPLAFKAKKDIGALIVNILIHIVADIVAGLLVGLLSGLPLIGWAFGLVGGLLGLYFTVSVVLSILDYLKILK